MIEMIQNNLDTIHDLIKAKGFYYVSVSFRFEPHAEPVVTICHSRTYSETTKYFSVRVENSDYAGALAKAKAHADTLKSGDELKREILTEHLAKATELATELNMDLLVSDLRDRIQKLTENALEDLRG